MIFMFIVSSLLLGGGIAVLMYGDQLCETCSQNMAAREVSQVMVKTFSDCCATSYDASGKKTVEPSAISVACSAQASTSGTKGGEATANALAPLYTCWYPKCNDFDPKLNNQPAYDPSKGSQQGQNA